MSHKNIEKKKSTRLKSKEIPCLYLKHQELYNGGGMCTLGELMMKADKIKNWEGIIRRKKKNRYEKGFER